MQWRHKLESRGRCFSCKRARFGTEFEDWGGKKRIPDKETNINLNVEIENFWTQKEKKRIVQFIQSMYFKRKRSREFDSL